MLTQNHFINTFFRVILVLLAITVNSQINTHQTIKKRPQIFQIKLEKSDHVKVTVSNTTGHVAIQYDTTGIPFSTAVADYCYVGEKVQLTWISQWKATGVISITTTTYEYAYEITVNGFVFKKENDVVNDFVLDDFLYSKLIQPKSLSMTVKFNSLSLSVIYIGIFLKGFQRQFQIVKPLENQIQNNFTIDIIETIKSYHFSFFIDKDLQNPITKHIFDIFIKIPNQMLKGCDGTNLYDSRIRACSSKSNEPLDYLQIKNIGRYPNFQIFESHKAKIKITIIEIESFNLNQNLNEKKLTLFISNTSENNAFRNMTETQLKLNYPLKQQCFLKSSFCNFILMFQPGNYTVMPVIFGQMSLPYVYLFERGDGQNVFQRYYSTLPLMAFDNNFYYQSGTILEFAAHRQKLTQVTMYCKSKILKTDYNLFGNATFKDLNGQERYGFNNLYSDIDGLVPNHDPNRIKLFFQLQPGNLYLLYVRFYSFEKSVQSNKENQQQNAQKDGFYPIISVDSLYLQAETLQFSIKNGKFPHKKVNMTLIDDYDSFDKQKESTEDEPVLNGKLMIIIVILTGVVFFAFFCLRIRKRRESNLATENQLIVENPESRISIELGKKAGTRMQISSVVHITINNDFKQPLL